MEYYNDLECLCNQSYPGGEVGELALLDMFKHGLPDEMVTQVNNRVGMSESLSLVLRAAASLENEMYPNHRTLGIRPRNTGEVRVVWAPGRSSVQSGDKPVPQCKYCKKYGHVIQDCRRRAFNEARRASGGKGVGQDQPSQTEDLN